MDKKIIIIGGGISGITTALTLQLMGFETTVYAEHLVDENAPSDPRFASLYPAASIIPHSVFTGQSEQLFEYSQHVFRYLFEQGVGSIKEHRHFELYEFPHENPVYATSLTNFSRIKDLGASDIKVPARKGIDSLHGWVFRCMVAEWPNYIQMLYNRYQKSGGTLHRTKIRKEEVSELKSDIIINCTGMGSAELFKDKQPLKVVKGHLLYIKDAPLFTDCQNHIPSYNYTPHKNVYATPNGDATDVYCYPRSAGMVLGGSRHKGIAGAQGDFIGKKNEDSLDINGVAIPRQIYELNKEILLETYGLDVSAYNSLQAAEGYRYTRSEDGEGLRLEASKEYGKTIIHNYGHGGAGVTLSWGCAMQVLHIITSKTGSDVSPGSTYSDMPLLNSLQLMLQKLYWNNFSRNSKIIVYE